MMRGGVEGVSAADRRVSRVCRRKAKVASSSSHGAGALQTELSPGIALTRGPHLHRRDRSPCSQHRPPLSAWVTSNLMESRPHNRHYLATILASHTTCQHSTGARQSANIQHASNSHATNKHHTTGVPRRRCCQTMEWSQSTPTALL